MTNIIVGKKNSHLIVFSPWSIKLNERNAIACESKTRFSFFCDHCILTAYISGKRNIILIYGGKWLRVNIRKCYVCPQNEKRENC